MLPWLFSQVNFTKTQYFETIYIHISIVLKSLSYVWFINLPFQGVSFFPSFSQGCFLSCHYSFPLCYNLPFIIQFKIMRQTLAMYYVLPYHANLESIVVRTFYSSLSLPSPILKRIWKDDCQKISFGDQAVGTYSSLVSFHLNLWLLKFSTFLSWLNKCPWGISIL